MQIRRRCPYSVQWRGQIAANIIRVVALPITSTGNAGNPLVEDKIPLLTCDVWEHAYYLDYQNRRPDFVTAFLDHLVDWEHVAMRLTKAPQVEVR